MLEDLPRLLHDFPPLPGLIKTAPADFFVEEIPLYEAAGSGTHTYFQIEKTGLSTMQAVHEIAQALDVLRRDIGYAGLKDARAITRQFLSIEHVDPNRVESLELPGIRVLGVARHGNKLRMGHLKANRFVIRVRQSDPARLADLQDALAVLARRGAPNYFGQQRFGGRGDAWAVGRELLRGDVDAAVDLILGRPGPLDRGHILRARQLYEEGKYAEAAKLWPYAFRDERRALRVLQHEPGRRRRAFAAIEATTRSLYISAYQSHLFNQVIVRRMPSGLDQLLPGDLAYVHGRESVFLVEDAAAEQPRAAAFEISPTGPLFGYRMTNPSGTAGEIEGEILAVDGLTAADFRNDRLRVKGARRPLRFGISDATVQLGADERGSYVALSFTLPRGCYATTLLRELFAAPAAEAAAGAGGGETAE